MVPKSTWKNQFPLIEGALNSWWHFILYHCLSPEWNIEDFQMKRTLIMWPRILIVKMFSCSCTSLIERWLSLLFGMFQLQFHGALLQLLWTSNSWMLYSWRSLFQEAIQRCIVLSLHLVKYSFIIFYKLCWKVLLLTPWLDTHKF